MIFATGHRKRFAAFTCALLILYNVCCSIAATALEMNPDLLFRQMEERTEQVFSLVAEVRLSSVRGIAFARLAIQSPDKFEMTINEGEFRVVFDGESLWIYIASLNEVMTLDGASGGGFLSEALRQWVNPREIVARITRRTMFTFFDIAMSEPPASGGWKLSFRPRAGGIWSRLFDVGQYHMEFASATCLPTRVAEFAPDGTERGVLEVLSYRLNEPLSKEWFRFEPASGVVRVPVSRVLMDKLSDGGEYLLGRLGSWFDGMKKSIDDWGF